MRVKRGNHARQAFGARPNERLRHRVGSVSNHRDSYRLHVPTLAAPLAAHVTRARQRGIRCAPGQPLETGRHLLLAALEVDDGEVALLRQASRHVRIGRERAVPQRCEVEQVEIGQVDPQACIVRPLTDRAVLRDAPQAIPRRPRHFPSGGQQRNRSQSGERTHAQEIAAPLDVRYSASGMGRHGGHRLSGQIRAGAEHCREEPSGSKQDIRIDFHDEVLGTQFSRQVDERAQLIVQQHHTSPRHRCARRHATRPEARWHPSPPTSERP